MSESDRIEQIRKTASSGDGENTSLIGAERIAAMRTSKPIPGRLVTFADESKNAGRIVIENTLAFTPENDKSPKIKESKDKENN